MTSNTYQVKKGDTLSSIAARHSITVGELLSVNQQLTSANGRDPNVIYPDELLTIPAPQFSSESAENNTIQACMSSSSQLDKINDEQSKDDKVFAIVVADRVVKNVFVAYHYSVQLWCYDGMLNNSSQMTVEELKSNVPHAKKVESIELLRDEGWSVWEKDLKRTEVTTVSISVIYFEDTSTKLAVLKEGEESIITAKWQKLTQLARQYKFAEQGGSTFQGNFINWPNSKYQLPWDEPFNNSNTFIRDIINNAGLKMVELPGKHPGDTKPSNITSQYASVPWRTGDKPLPLKKAE